MNMAIISMALLLLVQTAGACINRMGTKLDGSAAGLVPLYFDAEALREKVERSVAEKGVEMERQLRGATNFSDRNDYAIALMYLGRGKEAVDLLKALEQEKPGEFSVAANLGTAYELSGQNELALHWIKKGIYRNPQDHRGTEWLHVKILEAKLEQEKDPGFFSKHSVLALSAEPIGTNVTVGGQIMKTDDVAEAIQYQLGERLQFVKPPDPAVASLLYDYAAIMATTKSLETARGFLLWAEKFGYPADRIRPLLSVYDQRIQAHATRQATRDRRYGMLVMVAKGVISLGLVWAGMKGIKVLRARESRKNTA